jgi:hypothetical protein
MRACLVTGFVVVAPSGNIPLPPHEALRALRHREAPRGRADHVCAADTTMNDGRRLTYGATPARGTLRCRSARSGMRCSSLRSGHGFSLLRRRVRFF